MAACSGDTASGSLARGADGEVCFSDGTCDPGLDCVGKRCEVHVVSVGVLEFGWVIQVDGRDATCADVGATSLYIVVHSAGALTTTARLGCDTYGAAIDIAPGNYVFDVLLADAAGNRLTSSDEVSAPIEEGASTYLGTYTFSFSSGSAEGTACTYATDCRQGLLCVQDYEGVPRCRDSCSVPATCSGANACAPPYSCVLLLHTVTGDVSACLPPRPVGARCGVSARLTPSGARRGND